MATSNLTNILCVGGALHGQKVDVWNVHMNKKRYDIQGHSYLLEAVPVNREKVYFLRSEGIRFMDAIVMLMQGDVCQPLTRLMAFWRYDAFPFVLWGEIERTTDTGYVIVKGYKGYHFTPLFITNLENGTLIADALEQLKAERLNALSTIERDFKQKLLEITPFASN